MRRCGGGSGPSIRGAGLAAVLLTLSCAAKDEVLVLSARVDGQEWTHANVIEHLGEGGPQVVLEGEGLADPSGWAARVHYRPPQGEFVAALIPWDPAARRFAVTLPHYERGSRVLYFLEVRGPLGTEADFPPDARQGHYYRIKYKGHVHRLLIASHIAFMFGGALAFLVAGVRARGHLRRGQDISRTARAVAWGVGLLFIGGFPIGFLMGYFTFGKPWTGFPVGGDVTDSKTLIVFIYWFVTALLFKGSVFRDDPARNLVSARRFAQLVIAGVILTAAVYLIPHSI